MAEKRQGTLVGVLRRFCFGSDNRSRLLGLGIPQEKDHHFSFVGAVLRCSTLSIPCVMAA